MLKRYPQNDLPRTGKAAAFKHLDGAFDCALPQQWLDNFAQRTGLDYRLILLTTVWSYPEGYCYGYPVSICQEVQDAIDQEFPLEKEAA